MPVNILEKHNCTGCGACYQICPVKAVSMDADEEGFLYPTILSNCINCHLCEKVCPILKGDYVNEGGYIQTAISFLNSDYQEWKSSSSGGAFSAIVSQFSDRDTVVFGAAWDGLTVHHLAVKPSELYKLKKSKYISSSIGDTFLQAEKKLSCGKKVIFSGTPCQIAGLKSFLGREYSNLLTIDLICHGQGSPYVFRECLRDTESLINDHVISYEFRSKRKSFETEYLSMVKTEKCRYYLESERYTQLFLNLLCVRPSCGEKCVFHNCNRQGDLTIADCKGLCSIYPFLLGEKYNYSIVVSNSEQGDRVLTKLKAKSIFYPLDIKDILNYNPNFGTNSIRNFNERNEFFRNYLINPMDTIFRYTTPTVISRRGIAGWLYDRAPVTIRKFIIIFYRKINKLKR